jgi:hypothetical protein
MPQFRESLKYAGRVINYTPREHLLKICHIWWSSYDDRIMFIVQAMVNSFIVKAPGLSFLQLGFSVSNWQKVQLNTDLLKHRTRYLYTKEMVQLKLNEIKEEVKLKVRLTH